MGVDTINTISQTLPGVFKGNFWADTRLSLGSRNFGAECICVGRSRLPYYPNVARVRNLQEMPQDLSTLCLELRIYRIIPSSLSLFALLSFDLGQPAPDSQRVIPVSGDSVAGLFPPAIPGPRNMPQTLVRPLAELRGFIAE